MIYEKFLTNYIYIYVLNHFKLENVIKEIICSTPIIQIN